MYAGLRTSFRPTGREQWRNEKVDLFCQALSLCLHAFLADKRLCESEEKNETYAPSFSESLIVSGSSPAERELESENNKMHPVQALTSVFVSLPFKTDICTMKQLYLMQHYESFHFTIINSN